MSTSILRIRPAEKPDEAGNFVLTYTSQEKPAQATVKLPPLLSAEDQELIRWYLEEYRKFPFEPASTIARRTAERLRDIGEKLFDHLFNRTHDARALWEMADRQIETTRIEIENQTSRLTLPWEILWNPLDVMPISCRAASFIRTTATQQPRQLQPEADMIRVLLVISRPAGNLDAPFRSVAARILERVGDDARFSFEVLRPPTFAALRQKLEQASEEGRPYTILHFDGHGVHEDRMATLENRPAKRRRGYLLFEHPAVPDEPEYINGPAMAEALSAGRVPVLVLNACRSARTEIWDERMGNRQPLGSLADEILRAGQPAVLAMQYNIDVITASKFVADLYEGLADQRSLSEAVKEARRALFKETKRVSDGNRVIQDWLVPVLFELSADSYLLRTQTAHLRRSRSVSPPHAAGTSGIVGTDDMLMALERAFQDVPVVVLTGQVGSGKSTLVEEFIAWNARTRDDTSEPIVLDMCGGRALDPIVAAYRRAHSGSEPGEDAVAAISSWLTGQAGLCVLDNVGAGSLLETRTLENLFGSISAAGRRLLVVTRALEFPLALNSKTVNVSPLEFSDRLLLARAAIPQGSDFNPEAWRPILTFSQGNPAALGQLIIKFVSNGLNAPDAVLEQARVEPVGLSPDFSAALRTAFDEEELNHLALAALFEGSISANILPKLASVGSQPSPSDATIASIFERLSDMGLATPIGSNYYHMHPGLPGLLHTEFERLYSADRAEKIRMALVTYFSAICGVFYLHAESGKRHSYEVAKQTLALLEPTMWRVLEEAIKREWWDDVRNLTAALRRLLGQEGRHHEWRRLADDLLTLVTDPVTEQSLPGCESVWYLLLADRIERLIKIHSLAEAAWLQERILNGIREELAQREINAADADDKDVLIEQLVRMGDIRTEQGHKSASNYYLEALGVAQQIGSERNEQRVASHLALLYLSEGARDLKQVSYWLEYASALCSPYDRLALAQLRFIQGELALAQLQAEGEMAVDREAQLNIAADNFSVALTELLPAEPSDERATCELRLARVLFERWGSLPETMQRLQSAIAWYDADQNIYKASCARLEASRILSKAGDKRRAYFYAQEAGRGFASLAPHAETDVRQAHELAETLNINEGSEEQQLES